MIGREGTCFLSPSIQFVIQLLEPSYEILSTLWHILLSVNVMEGGSKSDKRFLKSKILCLDQKLYAQLPWLAWLKRLRDGGGGVV